VHDGQPVDLGPGHAGGPDNGAARIHPFGKPSLGFGTFRPGVQPNSNRGIAQDARFFDLRNMARHA